MYFLFKRYLDIILVIAISPLIVSLGIFISLIILFTMGRPIFFVQTRIGFQNQPFKMIKFRSMHQIINLKKQTAKDDAQRLTYFGRLLRSSSLDELPEFINVLMGQMSIVGPRPLLSEYLPYYSKKQIRRHDVLPGITGWAQVNGRNTITWNEKFDLDLWYVDNVKLKVDLKILFLTLGKVFCRSDVSPSDSEIMPRFDQLDDEL